MASIRRRLMTQREEGSILPNGYYPCEYIYSDGNSYIDTEYKHNNNTRVQMRAEAVGAIASNAFLFDGPNSDGTRKGVFYQVSKNSWAVDYAKSTARQYLSVGANDMLEIDFDKNICTVNGETKTFTASTFQSTVNLTLLCSNFDGTPQSFIKAKLYHCAIWDNDVLIRYYVPCFDAIMGTFGLYDTKNKVFYGSASDIDFKGKLIVPEGYLGVEYIYGDGNAFIDTGFIPNQDSRAVIDYEYTEVTNKVGVGFGATYAFAAYNEFDFSLIARYQEQSHILCPGVAGSRIVFDIDKNYTSVTHSGNKYSHFFNKIPFTCGNTLLLLRLNGVSAPLNTQTIAKVYFSAVWDNGTLVRLFAPCINSSNVYGLYDLVNGVFYQSAGTSQFGEVPAVYDFAYTGGEQIAQLESGTYKLECWGAQGGAGGTYADNGGKGGYSVGVLNLKDSTTLYINVGGKGEGNENPIYENNGGYNGGGKSGEAISSECYPGGGGGGATHIATKTGLLTSLTSFKSDILIVAGGGGGGGGVGSMEYEGLMHPFNPNEVKGGDGGGSSGSDGSSYIFYGSEDAGKGGEGAHGGDVLYWGSGGDCGIGEEGYENDGWYLSGSGGGGGGGYYGGGGGGSGAVSGTSAYDGNNGKNGSFGKGGNGGEAIENDGWTTSCGGGGGGGSAYLSSLLTSASSTSGERSGHGYARITKI